MPCIIICRLITMSARLSISERAFQLELRACMLCNAGQLAILRQDWWGGFHIAAKTICRYFTPLAAFPPHIVCAHNVVRRWSGDVIDQCRALLVESSRLRPWCTVW